MLLSAIRFAKSKNVLVLLRSAAGTGERLVRVRLRADDKMVIKAFDKTVNQVVLFREAKKIKSLK